MRQPCYTRTQIITVDDNTAPVIAAAPAAITVDCIGDVPAMVSLAWTDNCDAGGSVAGVDGLLRVVTAAVLLLEHGTFLMLAATLRTRELRLLLLTTIQLL